jgi:hypothetical protein
MRAEVLRKTWLQPMGVLYVIIPPLNTKYPVVDLEVNVSCEALSCGSIEARRQGLAGPALARVPPVVSAMYQEQKPARGLGILSLLVVDLGRHTQHCSLIIDVTEISIPH